MIKWLKVLLTHHGTELNRIFYLDNQNEAAIYNANERQLRFLHSS